MSALPRAWAAYAHFQHRLQASTRVDDHYWGREAALNLIMEPDFSSSETTEDDFIRAAASGSRRARHQIELQQRFTPALEAFVYTDIVDAREQLEKLLAAVNADDVVALVELGLGYSYSEIAVHLGRSEAALRSAVSRARKSLKTE